MRRESLWGTLRQSAPRLGAVIRHMRPTWHFESLAQLTPAFLEQQGIRGIIWDVDGTLTAYHDSHLHAEVEPAFRELLAMPLLRHVIVSNSPEARFSQLGVMLPSVPILRVYAVGSATRARRLHQGVDSLSVSDRDALMRADAHALRKPNSLLIRAAIELLGCSGREVVMVGDQYLTDIAGAGMAGVRSIKVRTIALSSFPPSVRAAQAVERLIYRSLHGRRPARADLTSPG